MCIRDRYCNVICLFQERLLLSVLPEHVAVKMRQDLGSAFDSQFKKIYMSRHENVRLVPFVLWIEKQLFSQFYVNTKETMYDEIFCFLMYDDHEHTIIKCSFL